MDTVKVPIPIIHMKYGSGVVVAAGSGVAAASVASLWPYQVLVPLQGAGSFSSKIRYTH